MDEARKAKNNHTSLIKQVITIEDDVKRNSKMEEHSRVGRCMKKDLAKREKEIDELEN